MTPQACSASIPGVRCYQARGRGRIAFVSLRPRCFSAYFSLLILGCNEIGPSCTGHSLSGFPVAAAIERGAPRTRLRRGAHGLSLLSLETGTSWLHCRRFLLRYHQKLNLGPFLFNKRYTGHFLWATGEVFGVATPPVGGVEPAFAFPVPVRAPAPPQIAATRNLDRPDDQPIAPHKPTVLRFLH